MNQIFILILVCIHTRNCFAIIGYLNESLDIEDWCIVNENELEDLDTIHNLTVSNYMTFTTSNNFNCFIEHNSMVLFDHVSDAEIKEILNRMSQYQLMNNYWAIWTNDSFTKHSILGYERPISTTTTFLVFENNFDEEFVYQIIGTATKEHRMISLGTTNEINLHSIIKENRHNRNLNGITITVNYAHLPPFCIVDGNQVNGTFYDLLKAMEDVLNFTLKIQPPSSGNEHWGKV